MRFYKLYFLVYVACIIAIVWEIGLNDITKNAYLICLVFGTPYMSIILFCAAHDYETNRIPFDVKGTWIKASIQQPSIGDLFVYYKAREYKASFNNGTFMLYGIHKHFEVKDLSKIKWKVLNKPAPEVITIFEHPLFDKIAYIAITCAIIWDIYYFAFK